MIVMLFLMEGKKNNKHKRPHAPFQRPKAVMRVPLQSQQLRHRVDCFATPCLNWRRWGRRIGALCDFWRNDRFRLDALKLRRDDA